MSQQEEKIQRKIQALETAKKQISDLIVKLQENPSLFDDEIARIAGGLHTDTTTPPWGCDIGCPS